VSRAEVQTIYKIAEVAENARHVARALT